MTRRFACLIAIAAFALALTAGGASAEDRPAEEGSIVGAWVGYRNYAGGKIKYTCTLKADGTYKTVSEYLDNITVERGKYKYDDGILETEPDGGFTGTYKITWEDKNTIISKGGGLTVTFKRQ